MQIEAKLDRNHRKTRMPSSIFISKYLLLFALFFLATSCAPAASDVATDYNINGDFLLEFTVTESTRDDQPVGSTVESVRTFSSNGNIVSAQGENSVSRGPRVGNTITLTRTSESGVKIDTTFTMTSNNSFTGSTTAFYPDDTETTWSLTGTRQ